MEDTFEKFKEKMHANRPDFFMSSKDYIEKMRSDENNISFWYPKIEEIAPTPKTKIFKVPYEFTDAIINDQYYKEEWQDAMFNWVKTSIMPKIKDMSSLLFIKNGTFSNKFCAQDCMCMKDVHDLTFSIPNIMYNAAVLGAGGNTEIAIRNRIVIDNNTPTIYDGLPLIPEVRVFYDFYSKKVLYSVNYWDYNYCSKYIYNYGDQLVFLAQRNHLQSYYEDNYEYLEECIEDDFSKVQGLTGKWSIDIMCPEYSGPMVIDMAKAEQSAYWDPKKCY